MDYTISSKDNKLIKHIRSLHQRKYRDRDEQFFVEGIKLTIEALKQEENITNIIVCPDIIQSVNGGKEFIEDLNKYEVTVNTVTENIFKDISDTETPQGVLTIIKKKKVLVENIIFDEKKIYILLDGVQDPGNLGTIIRTADAIAADGIFLSKGCADAYSPKTLRSSMGSIFRVPVIEKTELSHIIYKMKDKGIKIIATSLQANQYHYNLNYDTGIGLVVGSESNGICEEVLKSADYIVKIPMRGGAESLNASVAAGILMYEVIRDR